MCLQYILDLLPPFSLSLFPLLRTCRKYLNDIRTHNSKHETLSSNPVLPKRKTQKTKFLHKEVKTHLCMVAQTCNPTTQEVKASLGYTVRPCLKREKK
jgi:hypothetical protein